MSFWGAPSPPNPLQRRGLKRAVLYKWPTVRAPYCHAWNALPPRSPCYSGTLQNLSLLSTGSSLNPSPPGLADTVGEGEQTPQVGIGALVCLGVLRPRESVTELRLTIVPSAPLPVRRAPRGPVSLEAGEQHVPSVCVCGAYCSLRTTLPTVGMGKLLRKSMATISKFPMFVQMIHEKPAAIFKLFEAY